MRITLTPAVIGPNLIRVTLTNPEGKPYRPQQIQVALQLPARHLGPLAVTLSPDGPGRYVTKQAVPISITGQWQLLITIRSDAFDETSVIIPAPVK